MPRSRVVGRVATALALALVTLAVVAVPVAAHSGSLRGAGRESLSVPLWLFLTTGGGAIGASFLAASFVTDRAFLHEVHAWHRWLPSPITALRVAGHLLGLAGLVAVLIVGLFGPLAPRSNLAILTVWVVWWGAYVASTYLVGNTWPAVNPFRTIARPLPSLGYTYPERLGAWPAVVGLLALVWLEVVTPLADAPRLLAVVVAGYGLVSVAGSVCFGDDVWFETFDPISRAFRYYGAVAPLAVVGGTDDDSDDRLRLRLPGSGLVAARLSTRPGEAAFVVGILYVTTYDGFVGTPLWSDVAVAVVDAGLPPGVLYLGTYVGGFGLFYGGYRLAAGSARRTGETFVSRGALARRFAPSLLAIAAGYHVAHNLRAVVSLVPPVGAALTAPLSPAPTAPLSLPVWFSGVELAGVLFGHLLAVWVAHATAYDLFPGRLQAVKAQYGVTLAMVVYTMISLWVVTQPFVAPPFL